MGTLPGDHFKKKLLIVYSPLLNCNEGSNKLGVAITMKIHRLGAYNSWEG